MFLNCDAFSGYGVDMWDTSRVTDMKDMFRYTPTFNGDVSSWNVSRVTTMRGMFRQAVAFNSDISQWDLRRVTDISQMVRSHSYHYYLIISFNFFLRFAHLCLINCRLIESGMFWNTVHARSTVQC